MKIVVTNLTGNCGKTTLAKHLLGPQLPGARRISVEDLNDSDGLADLDIAARHFRGLAAELNTAEIDEHYLIDVGASNVRPMLEHFRVLTTTRADIDRWLLPCWPNLKQRNDTLATVKALMQLGVEASRIIVVPSAVEDPASLDELFQPLQEGAYLVGYQVCPVPVLFNDVYGLLKDRDRTVFDVAADTTDFKSAAREARGNSTRLQDIGRAMVVRDLARDAASNLRSVFNALGLEPSLVH